MTYAADTPLKISSLFTTNERKLPIIEPVCRKQEDFIPPVSEEAIDLYQKALQFEKNGRGIDLAIKEKNILELLTLSSNKGYWRAKAKLAAMYLKGKKSPYSIGIPQDIKKAIRLYEELVEEQNPYGYFMMAELLINGEHVFRNKRKSLAYFDLAYERGSPNAQYRIASRYIAAEVSYIGENLDKVNEYLSMGFKYYLCAGEQGFIPAWYELGQLAKNVSENPAKAARYYQKAAMLGDNQSMHNMYSILEGNSKSGYIPNRKIIECIKAKQAMLAEDALLTFPNLEAECPIPLHPILGDGMMFPDKYRDPGFIKRVETFGYPTNNPND